MGDLGPGAAPPKGWRVAQDDDGRAIDPFTPQERAEQAKAKEAARKAHREADKGVESIFDDFPQREPDALDGIVSAMLLEPRIVPGLEHPEARKERQRQELMQSRENAKKRAADDIEENLGESEASKYIADLLRIPDDEEDEDDVFARQETELERELEAEQGWE